MTAESFYQQLSRIMEERHLNYSDVAKLAGVTQQAVSKWMAGHNVPYPRNARRICKKLGIAPFSLGKTDSILMIPKNVPPRELRELSASMVLKALSLREVAHIAGVNYTIASSLLSGRRVEPERLAKIKRAIDAAPMPQEAAAR